MEPTIQFEYIPYEYQHAPVPGGGFVTGFCFHPKRKDILYARTDIGGVYRYDFVMKQWISLVDHVKSTKAWETYPLSIALDEQNPDWLYIVSGDWKDNYLCRSKDRGEHFEYFPLPAGVHGNASGRGTGERLQVDPVNSAILYFGSQSEGLLLSEDYGEHWVKLNVCQKGGQSEQDIAFVWIDPRSYKEGRCRTIVVSTSGRENSPGENERGPSLYISRDGGISFAVMPGQPEHNHYGNYPGFVGQRATATGNYLFVTLAAVNNSWNGWKGYACDMGGAERGCILRYELSVEGEIRKLSYITPSLSADASTSTPINYDTGFGGICADMNNSGHLICSTQCCSQAETVFYSTDCGDHWIKVLQGLTIGNMDFTGVPYMMPEYNNYTNLIHWLSDIKVDPFNPDLAVFNTGTGIFMTENLRAVLKNEPVTWRPSCRGLEETVHLNVYSPPAGEVQLIDIIGDLGGFAFRDLTQPAMNSFADENNHRYITCLNADYPDLYPDLVVVTARGNWTGHTTGGLILSTDQCKTWKRLKDPIGVTSKIDWLISKIRKPNTNSGWAAISADSKVLVWSVGEGQLLPMEAVVYSEDLGQSWHQVVVYDLKGQKYEANRFSEDIADSMMMDDDKGPTLKVLSDRVEPNVFYGFGSDSRMYLSTDRSKSFTEIRVPVDFPKLQLGGMDTIMPAEIRAESDRAKVVWIATGEGGLWRIAYDTDKRCADFVRITEAGESVFRQGMGKAAPHSSLKTIYMNGILKGEYGFYRSLDEGASWQRINHDRQMFGDIRSIVGDPRRFGRYFIATGTRGVLWGEPEKMG